ncbi:copper ion binding protein [Rhizobium rosettiformans]|jgi:copper chaperone|uniref:Heavy-metal-associated domain-containing protein n=2 Tax=Rhizobium rosettiformans TaxID=1368430 RepID=A0A4S8PNP2_9HYPH|nr:heavy-metal-associated domain-containing protein [Rhizobium rosettiformans]MBB5278289.1 copper ion binding protein [Rhizobium rosettiformans]MIL09063.1 copper chaperone [Salmonella enterica subsp. enterica serovar Enteritidis]THV32387.1 heavy-metal-associated domain-containing protein [Rhizobium rosettiformans W3]
MTTSRIIEFNIEGMDCADCVSTIESEVRRLPGIAAVKVSLVDNSALVKLDTTKVSESAIYDVVEHAGYAVQR